GDNQAPAVATRPIACRRSRIRRLPDPARFPGLGHAGSLYKKVRPGPPIPDWGWTPRSRAVGGALFRYIRLPTLLRERPRTYQMTTTATTTTAMAIAAVWIGPLTRS